MRRVYAKLDWDACHDAKGRKVEDDQFGRLDMNAVHALLKAIDARAEFCGLKKTNVDLSGSVSVRGQNVVLYLPRSKRENPSG
jgi:hypothetical protein